MCSSGNRHEQKQKSKLVTVNQKEIDPERAEKQEKKKKQEIIAAGKLGHFELQKVIFIRIFDSN